MVLQEANTEPLIAKVAVAAVALDRMRDSRWPSNAHGVIYQPWQFTGMRARIGRYTDKNIEDARMAVWLARQGRRPCGHNLWYHRVDVDPAWSEQLHASCVLGEHIFYRDRP